MESQEIPLIALVPTVLKKEPKNSTELAPNQKVNVVKGKSYKVIAWEKISDYDIKVTLSHQGGTWYAFEPHFYFPPTDEQSPITAKQHGSADTIAKKLSEADFVEAAKLLDCDVAAIKAVVKVESAGSGFLANQLPRILYEPHIFGRLSNYKYNKTHPFLSSYRWNRALYSQGGTSWQKLRQAMNLNEIAAIQSAS
ncbi:MAG: N-acetylmuramidase domain-containing protein, partial [Waterburya sp.]